MKHGIIATGALLISLVPAASNAAEWSDQQQALWNVVEESWAEEAGETGKWPDAYLHDKALNWAAEWPVPRGKASATKWTTFRDQHYETLQYELFPHAIVIEGETGVVFYSVVQIGQAGEDDAERTVEGLVETLVRDRDGWKFLALTGFNTKVGDD